VAGGVVDCEEGGNSWSPVRGSFLGATAAILEGCRYGTLIGVADFRCLFCKMLSVRRCSRDQTIKERLLFFLASTYILAGVEWAHDITRLALCSPHELALPIAGELARIGVCMTSNRVCCGRHQSAAREKITCCCRSARSSKRIRPGRIWEKHDYQYMEFIFNHQIYFPNPLDIHSSGQS